MKVLNFLFALCLVSFLASCGGDSCEVADWTGTYTLDADSVADCDNKDDWAESITIAAGSADGAVSIGGTDVTPTDCKISFDDQSGELDGGELKITFGGCTGTYK